MDLLLLLLLLVLLVLQCRQLQIAVGTAGLHLPAPDRSGHCGTSSASSRSQWALPDLNCKRLIAVGNAGPQPRAPDPSGHCRTSCASSRSQWATPDLNRELQIPVGNAGPQQRAPDPSGQRRTSTASSRSQWATPDLNCEVHIPVGNAGPQLRAQIEYQILSGMCSSLDMFWHVYFSSRTCQACTAFDTCFGTFFLHSNLPGMLCQPNMCVLFWTITGLDDTFATVCLRIDDIIVYNTLFATLTAQ